MTVDGKFKIITILAQGPSGSAVLCLGQTGASGRGRCSGLR